MGKSVKEEPQKNENQNLKGIIFGGFVILGILILIVFFSLSMRLDSLNSDLNEKIGYVNESVNQQSDDHFITVQKEITKSIVAVRSTPVSSTDQSSASQVIYLDNNGMAWKTGTGFSIDDKGDILTAYHIVEGGKTVEIILPDMNSKVMSVEKVQAVPSLDLAILYVNSSVPPVKLQEGNFTDLQSNVGSSIAFTGFPGNLQAETTIKGSVAGIMPSSYNNIPVIVYILGGTANKGNSGGPVFSLKSGKVIGIINQKVGDTEGIAISTAINKNLLDNLMNAPQPGF
jgi:S1-C subfamily serine protease